MTADADERAVGRHPIQVVVSRTGLEADRIRQWERRYGAVSPARSDGGHRLYSDEDVERLRLLARAVAGGRRIGDVAPLPDADLEHLVEEDFTESLDASPVSGEAGVHDRSAFVETCIERILRLDANGLEALLRRALSKLGMSGFVLYAVRPLLERIGRDWERGRMTPSYEHMASAVLRKVLADATTSAGPASDDPTLVVTTPKGALHELGALMVAALAAAEGWSVIFLGTDLPALDVAEVVEASGARALALSIVHPPSDPGISAELDELLGALPQGVTLILGGRAASSYEDALDGRVWHRPDLSELPQTLASIQEISLEGLGASVGGPDENRSR